MKSKEEDVMQGATELREGRREMRTGVYIDTPYGQVKMLIKVDMPGRVSEDDYKSYMRELGGKMQEAFAK